MLKLTPEIESLVAQFTVALQTYMKQAVNDRVIGALNDLLHDVLGGAAANPARSKFAPPAGPAKTQRVCPIPGCGKPAAGPKYQWRCRDHGTLKSAKPAAQATRPSRPIVVMPQAKTATVIPADVAVTRLPPGPSPREKQSLPDSAKLCRLPGCRNKHSGPRYDLFCREHYAALNAGERRKYKDLWRAQHATT